MASPKKPPTPNWSTHPLAQKVLKSFKKLESMAPTALTTPGFSAPLNAVYYPNWKVYDTPPSSMELDKITHVYYAFALYVPSLHHENDHD